jgi:hypothetical protein
VDGADFLTWQLNLGLAAGATRGQGDSNLDGRVDAEDLSVWTAQFGSEGAVAAAATVGAPSAEASLLAALAQANELLTSQPSNARTPDEKPSRHVAFAAWGSTALNDLPAQGSDGGSAQQRRVPARRGEFDCGEATTAAPLVDSAFATLPSDLRQR